MSSHSFSQSLRLSQLRRSAKRLRARREQRQMLLENLEPRALLAADWQNPFYSRDVNNDGTVTPSDVLSGINELNARTLIGPTGDLPTRSAHPSSPLWDVNGDGKLAPQDVLVVINAINSDVTAPSITAGLQRDTAPGGTTNTDRLTSDGTISGSIVDDLTGISSFNVRVDNLAEQRVSVQRDGSFVFDTGLARDGSADGDHTIRLRAADGRLNAAAPIEFTFTLDTIGPAAPSGLDLVASSDSGRANDDNRTNDKTPTFQLAAPAGAVVGFVVDGTATSTQTSTGNVEFTTGDLTDGSHEIAVTVEDLAGNASPPSAPLMVVIDTQAPAPPAVRLSADTDSGQDNSDGVTRVTAPTFVVDAESGAFVRLFLNDQQIGSGTANSPVNIPGPNLNDGSYAAQATSEDLAGNVSARSAVFTTVIDTLPPDPPTVDLSATSDTGTIGDKTTTAGRVTLVGRGTADALIRLTSAGVSALAAHSGDYQLAGVPLVEGDNLLSLDVEDRAGNLGRREATFRREPAAATTDPVLRWNAAVLNAIRAQATNPPESSRIMAILHIAILDAVNNIDGTPSYYVKMTPAAGASASAAVSAAAHRVLSHFFPSQQISLDAILAAALLEVPDGAGKTAGQAFGRAIADAVLELRENDGWDHYTDYSPMTGVGNWQPTAPMYDVALLPQWADLEPFAMTSSSQFQADGPPDLSSVEYAAAYEEVKNLGRATGSTRTADQTVIARFWADGGGTYTPPGHWNAIAEGVATERKNSLAENARTFALLNIALADAGITAWNTKYAFNFWRPVTAIQAGAADGNNQTVADANWQPLLITPPFPEYVSGHSTYSGAAAQILTHLFGDQVAFTTTSQGLFQADGVTPAQRSFASFNAAAEEAGRSRIYGGIHFEFSNQDGLAAGRSLADFVWDRFSTSTDDQAPRVLVTSPMSGDVSATNMTVAGRVLDNISGVQTLEVSLDGGAFAPVTIATDGAFTVTTTLALDGTADGGHRVTFRARDFRGNEVTTSDLLWTLDTRTPTIAITITPQNGLVGGTVNGTGSSITRLTYQVDNLAVTTMAAPNTDGSFEQRVDRSQLAPGEHTIKVTAVDEAGNSKTETSTFTLEQRIPLTVTDFTPDRGTEDIGTTFRPQVFFSRPVNKATLTTQSFFATDTAGNRIPATVVTSQDGDFAWLFFTNPLPGASTVTIHVDGDVIVGAADGAALDADANGVAGGDLEFSFTTVSLTPLAGTSLSGKVVDPGADLKPMTFDDQRAGPDGVLHTADDVFLLPIAGVKVFILGLEDKFVLTDAQGNFHFDSVPAGNVKLAVDGRTATNAPTGIYFPEMVMDLSLRVGEANTVMGAMGTREEMAANAGRPEVYLPRLQTSILETVSGTGKTTIAPDATAAPNLTEQQRQYLTLEVQPQSVLGPDGRPLAGAQVGMSTVPAELVRDMLPPGLLQHTFDITIQAPGASTFATPLQLTLPNVFNSPPGTKLNFLSFDHTTGRLVIEGTGTVSADGQFVVTDEGTGITKPGWHGFTPPITCGESGGAPLKPQPRPLETVENNPVPIFLHDDVAHTGVISREFNGPNRKNPAPPAPANGCPPRPDNTEEDPATEVTIEVSGPLGKFMKKTGDWALSSNSYTLAPGSGKKTFKMDAKSLADIFGANGFTELTQDQLFGATVRISVTSGPAAARVKTIDTYAIYKWVTVIDATFAKDKKGTSAAFMRTFADGEFTRNKSITTAVPEKYATTFEGSGTKPFEYNNPPQGNGITRWSFKPAESDAGPNAITDDVKIVVAVPFRGGTRKLEVGTVQAKGTATKQTTVSVDVDGYKAELKRVILALKEAPDGKVYYEHPGGARRFVSDKFSDDAAFGKFLPSKREPGPDGVAGNADDTFQGADLDAKLTAEGTALLNAVLADYDAVKKAIKVQASNTGADVQMNWMELGRRLFGQADYDSDEAFERPLICTPSKCGVELSSAAQQWALAEGLNKQATHTPNAARQTNTFAVGINVDWTSNATFAEYLANTVSHELGHTFGLNDAYNNGGLAGGDAKCGVAPATGSNCNPNDIMRSGNSGDINLTFSPLNIDLLKAAMGLLRNGPTPMTNALKLYRDNINLPGGVNGIREELPVAPVPDVSIFQADQQLLNDDFFEIGQVAITGATGTAVFTVTNSGYGPLTIQDVDLSASASGFSVLTTGLSGKVLAVGDSTTITVQFDPARSGVSTDELVIRSDANIDPVFRVRLAGEGISTSGSLHAYLGGAEALIAGALASNNFGGEVPGASVAKAEFATITNDGSLPLTITAIDIEQSSGFSLTGIPTNLATTPITLAHGETFTFGVQFTPNHVGLHRGEIVISSNDPLAATTRLAVVGTGLDEEVYPQWGDDFVAVESPLGAAPLRVRSDAAGNFQLSLPPDQPYHLVIFDPVTGLVSHGYGTTAAAGAGFDLTEEIVFSASVAADADFDGLPEDIEFAIGSDASLADTDGDRLPDGVEVEQGIDPLDGRPMPLGVIARLPVRGEARQVVLEGGLSDAGGQIAYVATGSFGMAIVNATSFFGPLTLGQIDLAGTATDIAVDSRLQVAVVATNAGGAQFVDVSNPRSPRYMRTVAANGSQVELLDGVAYVSDGGKLKSFDVGTATLLGELDLGGAEIVNLARERSVLFALDAAGRLTAVNVSGGTFSARDSLVLPAALSGGLFVGGGVAYVGSDDGTTGGFATVDVSNENDLRLLAGPSDTTIAATDLAATGSGQAISIGRIGGTNQMRLLNVSNTSNTGTVASSFTGLPGELYDVALGSGFGFVAAGSGGLLTVNYLGFDTQGQPPTADVGTSLADIDLNKPGVQVPEGTTVPLLVSISDDVQIRNVELLINGRVVRNDVSFPFDFSTIALPSAADGIVRVQVRATDMGGNIGVSRVLQLEAAPDTTPPTITSTNPTEGSSRGQNARTVQVEFSESMDSASLTAANIQLLGPGGAAIVPSNIQLRSDDRIVQFTYPSLGVGAHQLVLKSASLLDRAGNPVGGSDVVRHFTVTEHAVTWINPLGGDWSNPANWDSGATPGPGDHVVIDVPGTVAITYHSGETEIAELYSRNPFALSGGVLTVNGTVQVDNQFLLNGGTLRGATVLAGAGGEDLIVRSKTSRLDGATINTDLDLRDTEAQLRVANGLTLHGTAFVWGVGAQILIEGSQTIAAGNFELDRANYLSAITAATAGVTLTLGPDVRISGSGLVGQYTFSDGVPFAKIVNQGTIAADSLEAHLSVNAVEFVSAGTLVASHGGQLDVNGLTGDLNAASVEHGRSRLSLSGSDFVVKAGITAGPGTFLNVSGSWTNAAGSTITANDATVSLSTYHGPWNNQGVIELVDSQTNIYFDETPNAELGVIHRTGGTLQVNGSYDNRGQTLALDTFLSTHPDFNGRILGGTVVSSDGQPIALVNNGPATSYRYLELEDVTLDVDLNVGSRFDLAFAGAWKNMATITVDGASVELGGEVTTADLGVIHTQNGGNVDVFGLLDNRNATLHIDETFENWNFSGEIRGGRITFADPDVQRFAVGGDNYLYGTTARLSGVTVEGDLEVNSYKRIYLVDGTTFRNVYLSGDQPTLVFDDGALISGTIWMEPHSNPSVLTTATIALTDPTGTLTVGPNGAIRTAPGVTGYLRLLPASLDYYNQLPPAGTLVNRGLIAFSNSNISVSLEARTVVNEGEIKVDNGASVTNESYMGTTTFRNDGTISLGEDSHLSLVGLEGNLGHLVTTGTPAEISFRNSQDLVIDQDLSLPGTNLRITGSFTNNATITVANASVWLGANGTAGGSNRWTNPGEIHATNVQLELGGEFPPADLNRIERTNGTGRLVGTLLNDGGTLPLDTLLDEWSLRSGAGIRGGVVTASGPLTLPADTRLRLDGVDLQVDLTVADGTSLEMLGNWKNSGSISVDGSLVLGGTTTTSRFGEISNDTGTVTLTGRLDNTGSTLALNDATGVLTIAGGTIVGGTLDVGEDLPLRFDQGAQLEGVTVTGDLHLADPFASLTLRGGTTFGTIHLQSFATALWLGADQSISGTVLIDGPGPRVIRPELAGGPITITETGVLRALPTATGVVTVGGAVFVPPEATVLTSSIENHGLIESIQADGVLALTATSVVNLGTVRASAGGTVALNGMTGNANQLVAEAGGTISLAGSYALNMPVVLPAGSRLELNGHWTNSTTITATDATIELGGHFTESDLGTITRTGGELEFTGEYDNTGATVRLDELADDWSLLGGTIVGGTVGTDAAEFELPAGSIVVLDGVRLTGGIKVPAGATLVLQGNWINDGAITVSGGTLNLGGDFTVDTLGTVQRTSGDVLLSGRLDNRATSLALNNTTGSWRIVGGTIVGGTVSLADGQQLIGTAQGGVLNGVAISGDLLLAEPDASLLIGVGTTFTNAHLAGGTSSLRVEPGVVLTGNVLFEGSDTGVRVIDVVGGTGIVTFAPSVTLKTVTGFGGHVVIGSSSMWLDNRGRVSSEVPDREINIMARTLENAATGKLESSNNGVLRVSSDNWSNAGSLKTTGGSLFLTGTFTTADLAGLSRTDGSVQINHAMIDNWGRTWTLNDSTGSVQINVSQIHGGTLASSGNEKWTFTGISSTLDAVRVDGTIEIVDTFLILLQDLEVNGLVTLGANDQYGVLYFQETASITGTGSIVFRGGGYSSSGIQIGPPASVVTIDSGITIRGNGAIGQSYYSYSPASEIVNRGKIIAESGELRIGTTGDTTNPKGAKFTNAGSLEVAKGGTLTILNLNGSIGNIAFPTSTPDTGSLSVDGVNYVIDRPLAPRPSSNLSLLGSFTNAAGNPITMSGGTLTLGSGTEHWHNLGTITLADTNMVLGGEFGRADLGIFSRTGQGKTDLVGTLINTGETLALSDSTGPWYLRRGTIRGGTVTQAGNGRLLFPTDTGGVAFAVTPGVGGSYSSYGTLDGVTLTESISVPGCYSLNVLGTLTLDTATIDLTPAADVFCTAELTFMDHASLLGTGDVLLGLNQWSSTGIIRSEGTTPELVVGPNIVVHGVGNLLGQGLVTIRGTLRADVADRRLVVHAASLVLEGASEARTSGELVLREADNRGTITVPTGGTVTLENHWHNHGTLDVLGGTLNLDGEFSSADLGTFHREGGNVNLRGVLNNLQFSQSLVTATSPARYLVPTNDALGATWRDPSFVDTSWTSGKAAVGYVQASELPYAGLIETDVKDVLYGVNETLYVRIPFSVADPSALSGLLLKMGYDDGFAVYLNGVEVATRNLFDPQWNSRSYASHDGDVPESIDLTSYLGLLHAGTNILAIQGANTYRYDSDFLVRPELLAALRANDQTFTLDANTGSWDLRGGTIRGGTYAAVDGEQLRFTTAGGNLIGLTANSDLNLASEYGATAQVSGGLTLNGTARLGDVFGQTYGGLYFAGTQTIDGNGTIVFGKSSSNFLNTYDTTCSQTNRQTVTFGSGLTIRGSSGHIATGYCEANIVNRATIDMDGSGSETGFGLDADFVNGSIWVDNKPVDVAGVANAAPAAVYQTGRYGTFSYDLGGLVAGATYTVRLHFAELEDLASGDRSFHVNVNGNRELSNFDIVAEAGGVNHKAVVRDVTGVADPDGRLTIGFESASGSRQYPLVNGLQILSGAQVVRTIDAGQLPGGDLSISAPLVNEGTVIARKDEQVIFQKLVANTGSIRADQGSVKIQGENWTSTGTIQVNEGALNLAGSFSSAGLGTITRTGGTIELTGEMNNTGHTLTLNNSTGPWKLVGGTIRGGSYSASGSGGLIMTSSGGLLEGLTVNSDLDLSGIYGGQIHVKNGLTLNANIRLGDAIGNTYAGVYFDGGQTVTGNGTFVLGKSSSNFLDTYNSNCNDAAAGTVVIDTGITIRGDGGNMSTGACQAPFENRGTIAADGSASDTGWKRDTATRGSAVSSADTIDVAGVTNAAAPLVYQTGRTYDEFSYSVDGLTAGGSYTVRLHFAELQSELAVGDRVFHVEVNGDQLLADFDILAAAGGVKRKAVVRDITGVADPDGKLTINFVRTSGSNYYPLVNGLEILSGAQVVHDIDAGNVLNSTITVNSILVNQGTLTAKPGETLDINSLRTNSGTINADGGTIQLGGDSWKNTGTLEVDNGTLDLGGSFGTADLGSISRTGGTINLTGTLDNTGNSLVLNNSLGVWNLVGGTIRGGSYSASGTGKLVFTGAGVLDGLTANSDLDFASVNGASVTVKNGMTLNATAHIGDALGFTGGGLFFDGGQTVTGSGTFVMGRHVANFLIAYNTNCSDAAAGTLVFDTGITIRGDSGNLFDNICPAGLENRGTIAADGSGSDTGWERDKASRGIVLSSSEPVDMTGVPNAAPALVYQTGRSYDEFSYSVAGLTAGGSYTVRLHFAELQSEVAIGDRVFHVEVNGDQLLTDFDILGATGGVKRKAVVRDITGVADQNGKLTINFLQASGVPYYPLVNGVQVLSGALVVDDIDVGNVLNSSINVNSTLVNHGTLSAKPGETLNLGSLRSNSGTIRADGGTVRISGDSWKSTGSLEVDNGTLELSGTFTTADFGTISRTGGTINLTGILDNTGKTLELNSALGVWNLTGGTIRGGSYSASGSGKLLFTGAGVLDGLTANSDLDFASVNGASVTVKNGMTLNATAYLGDALGYKYGGMSFDGGQTITGTGTFVMGRHSSNFFYTYNTNCSDAAVGTVVIDTGITIRGDSGTMSTSYCAAAFENRGTIAADGSGSDTGWERDTATRGGVMSSAEPIDVAGVTNPAPALVYQTGRTHDEFSYAVDGLTPGGSYTVRLHFAEIQSEVAVGDRVFHVEVNGDQLLTDFDILGATGGVQRKAVVREITGVADQDGKLTINFRQASGASYYPFVNGLQVLSGAMVVNDIDAGNVLNGSMTFNSTLVNQGTLTAKPGEQLIVNFFSSNSGTIHADGGTIRLDGTSWKNTGTLEVDNGTLTLGGAFTRADLGTISRTGGTINLTGILDNTGNSLVLNNSLGAWNLVGGTILGGSYSASDSGKLVLTPSGGTLDGLTVNSDLDLASVNNANATVKNGMTLNATAHLGDALGTLYGGLYFDGGQTISGTGTFVLGPHGSNYLNTYNTNCSDAAAGTVVFDTGITIRGDAGNMSTGYCAAAFENRGTIAIDGSGSDSGLDRDEAFTGGSPVSTTAEIDVAGVTHAASKLVYHHARTGDFSYLLDGLTAGASYTVRLHFAEIQNGTQIGQRLFHVDVNGNRELTDFDILAETGGVLFKAAVRDLNVTADSNGELLLAFSYGNNDPLLSGLELLSGGTVIQSADSGHLAGGTITVNTTFVNSGTVAASAGFAFTFNQGFTQTAGGVVETEVRGLANEQLGRITVNGDAVLAGELRVDLDGFDPSVNDTLIPLTFGSNSGVFDTINTVGLPATLVLAPTYNPGNLTLTVADALRAAPGQSPVGSQPEGLASSVAKTAVQRAVARWLVGSDSDSRAARLAGIQVVVTELSGDALGAAAGNTIWLDLDAAGYGWFVDPLIGGDGSGDAQHAMDLLSAIDHELGHLLGLTHDDDIEAMIETLAAGEQHRFDPDEAF